MSFSVKPNIKKTYIFLCEKYCSDKKLIEKYWKEIETYYNSKDRFYHNLVHISQMLENIELAFVSEERKILDLLFFAAFYHDIIYDINSKYNEKESAKLAIKRLSKFDLEKEDLEKISFWIEKTASHFSKTESKKDYFTSLFLDADLAILGSEKKDYIFYNQQIRKEYSSIPDEVYFKNRKLFLEFLLKRKAIFRLPFFKEKFNEKAIENIKRELC